MFCIVSTAPPWRLWMRWPEALAAARPQDHSPQRNHLLLWIFLLTPELTTLALAFLLQVVQFALYAIPANRDIGPGYTMSARDREPSRAMSERTARLGRAFENHFQGLILFTVAVVVVTLSGQATGFTAICAWVYLGARVLYVPAYAFGLNPWRSIVWMMSFAASIAMVVSTLI